MGEHLRRVPVLLRQLTESSQILTDENGGAVQLHRLHNPEMDALLQELYSATDPRRRVPTSSPDSRACTRELQPEVVLVHRSNVRGVNPKIGNDLQNPGTASDMWNIGDWYLPAE